MLQVENCIIAHPDSALSYLATLEKEIKNEPEETRMYYNLLKIKAEDKLYIPHTSDSLIKIITEFYEGYGDSDKLMEAYYYLGSTYRDMNDAPNALRAFQDVVDIGKDSKKIDLLAQTYGQMGNLFTRQDLFDESINSCKQALKYHLLQNNYSKSSIAIRNIARIYYSQKKQDSAFIYYQKAYKYALSSKDNNKINSLLSELGCFYYDIGKKDSAKILLLNAINNNYDIENAILNLGLIYQDANQLDSAQYCFFKIIKSEDIYKQRYGYQHLSQIEAEKNNYHLALKYAYKYQEIRDSIDKITRTAAISKIHTLYNYQHTEKENSQLKLDNEAKNTQVFQLLFAFMVFIAISLCGILYLRKKKQKAIDQERKLRQIKEEQYAQSVERIEDNKKKIYTLKQQLRKAEENDIVNKQIIQSQKEQLESINNQVIAIRNEQNLLETTFEQSPIYILFHRASNDDNIKITEEEWGTLQKAIDKTFHDFTNRLYALYPQISSLELRICYLIKISMQVKGIAKLVNRSKPAISIARARLYKKIHGKDGSIEMLDRFIINL